MAPVSPGPLTYRQAARVILLDPADRVLLSHDVFPTGHWWVLPGGGVEPGETPAAAALREVQEETGFTDVVLGPLVIRHRFQARFFDQQLDQDEWIFLGRTAGGVPDMAGLDDRERTFVGGFQWLSSAELTAVPDTVYPLGLPGLVAAILADGPPAEPWQLGGPP